MGDMADEALSRIPDDQLFYKRKIRRKAKQAVEADKKRSESIKKARQKQQICNQCRLPMVVRTNNKTQQKFWGCRNFPKCRSTKSYE